MDAQDIIEALVSRGLCVREHIVGCSAEEIAGVERTAPGPLPLAYKSFLSAAGRDAPGFFTGTSLFLGQIEDLTESAADLLRENNEPFSLPPGAFVFSMHQGYVFHYFVVPGGDDPPVFTYCEGKGPPRPAGDSFTGYLIESMDWLESLKEEARQYQK
jgi:hypothetical protein